MFSGDAGPASQHAEELTAPPEGMYWAQVQGLWALRPIVDLERSVDLSGYRPRALSGRPARSTAFPPHLVHQPSRKEMVPLHQMPAANRDNDRLDETQVKTIQTKVNNKLDPAMPVRTHTPWRLVLCGPRAQHKPRRLPNNNRIDSLTGDNLSPNPKL